MDALNQFLENLKEKFKLALQEQQESELYLSLKEKYDALSNSGQLLVKIGGSILLLMGILFYPTMSFIDSTDLSAQFQEKREALKDLLKIERDYSAFTFTQPAQAPFAMKSMLDQKILAQGIKVEQIKDTVDASGGGPAQVEQRGVLYTIQHVTVRQAIDVAYELEQTDRSLRIADLELIATQADPHFYDMKIKLINFSAKAEIPKDQRGK